MIWKWSQKRAWFAFWLNVNLFHTFIFLDYNSCLNFQKQQFLSSEEKPIEAFKLKNLSLNLIFIKRNKWFVCCSYNRNKSYISRHLDTLRKSLDLYSAHYENTILIEDFNVSIDDHIWNLFVNRIGLKVLLKILPILKIRKVLLALTWY